jgi:putative phosphoesterase
VVGVRIALFSDVHANRAALRAVLEAIDDEAPDAIFALGDLVGRGPDPQAVVEIVKRRGIESLRGNWDEWTSGGEGWDERPKRRAHVEATRSLMKKKTRLLLADLPETRTLDIDGTRVFLAHGSPRDPVELLVPEMTDEEIHDAVAPAQADVVAVGHSHRAFVRDLGTTLVINTGTVGYPFDRDPRPSFALLDLSDGRSPKARIVRVPYRMDRNLTSLARREKEGVIRAELASAYRGALLGDVGESMDTLSLSDSTSDALVKLLAPRIRTLYKRWTEMSGPWMVIDFFVPKHDAAIELRAALEIARPLLERDVFRRRSRRLRDLVRALVRAREPYLIEADLMPFGSGDVEEQKTRLEVMKAFERMNTQRKEALNDAYTRDRFLDDGLMLMALTMRAKSDATLLDAARKTIARIAKRLKRPVEITVEEAARVVRFGRIARILDEPLPNLGLRAAHTLAVALAQHIEAVAAADSLLDFVSSPLTQRRLKNRQLAPLKARAQALVASRSDEHLPEIEVKTTELRARFQRTLDQIT